MDNLREQINQITSEMMVLLEKRLEVSKEIGSYKKEHQLPLSDKKREQFLIETYQLEQYPEQSRRFLELLFELSKEVQQ